MTNGDDGYERLCESSVVLGVEGVVGDCRKLATGDVAPE